MKLNLGRMLRKRPADSTPPSDSEPSPAADSSAKAAGSPAKKGGSMKIGTKIFGLVGFCLLLLTAVAGASVWQMNKIGMEIEGIAERDLPLTEGLTKVTIHQLEQAVNLERAFRAAEVMDKHHEAKEEFETAVRKFEEFNATVEKEFAEVKEIAQQAHDTAVTEEERHEFQKVLTAFDGLIKEHKDYDHHAVEAFKLIVEGQLEQALTKLPKIEAEQSELDHELEKLLFEVEKFTEHAAKTAEEHEHFAIKLLAAISIIALIIGVTTAIFLVRRSISRPLTEIVTGLDALNADDMSVDVNVYNDDEIGAVAKAYAIFKESMIKTRELEADQVKQKQRTEEEKRAAMNKLADDFDASVGGI
ncbi:MAG: Tar ligand binding domain-containing protein, partial [Hyphomicrobiales bacterium]|nr:Tar ligand binding domain-containing protein [Hyphomicrobiales bacterium]